YDGAAAKHSESWKGSLRQSPKDVLLVRAAYKTPPDSAVRAHCNRNKARPASASLYGRRLGFSSFVIHDGRMITIVSGLPRSGTSLMMQMLVAGGMRALADGERQADTDNPRGYLEWERIKQLPNDP